MRERAGKGAKKKEKAPWRGNINFLYNKKITGKPW
jgi:hypothetical protein